MAKKFSVRHSIFLSLTIILIFFLYSCDSPSEPPQAPPSGVQGKIYNTHGEVLKDVKVYCLFYYSGIPSDWNNKLNMATAVISRDFPFELFQSFPNPCAHAFYLRFSLPEKCTTELSFHSKLTGEKVFQRTDTLLYGYYQFYFNDFIDEQKLTNGIYTYRLTAKGETGTTYTDEKNMLIINDTGIPASISDTEGSYYFDSKNAFIGDTVFSYYDNSSIGSIELSPYIILLYKKEGYEPLQYYFQLIPSLILSQDIIMEEKK